MPFNMDSHAPGDLTASRVITAASVELSDMLGILAPLAPQYGRTMYVRDAETDTLAATIHVDGGIDYTAHGAAIVRVEQRVQNA